MHVGKAIARRPDSSGNRNIRLSIHALVAAALLTIAPLAANAQSAIEYWLPTPSPDATHIVLGPDGNLWFTEISGNKIGRITPTGAITEFPVPTPGGRPVGIAVGPDGNLWFAEGGANKIGRITTAGVISEFSTTPGWSPGAITAGPDGNLWFTEQNNANTTFAIGRITTTGVITDFPTSTVSQPGDIVTGPDGNLWFTEYFQQSGIGRMTITGAYVHFLFSGPASVTVGPDGALWFTSITNNVGRITTSGAITQFPVPPSNGSEGIVTGPDGNLWITHNSFVITRLTTAGATMQCALPRSGRALAVGPDGNLWIAAFDRIIRFTIPTGNCPPLHVVDVPALTPIMIGLLMLLVAIAGSLCFLNQRRQS